MLLKNIGTGLLLTIFMSGCASWDKMAYPLPKCNGYARRPLNKSMWDWDTKNPPSTPMLMNNDAEAYQSGQDGRLSSILSKDLTPEEIESYKNCGEWHGEKKRI
ncbi:type IV secretion protein VblB7 [Bartonella australis AUST/NH1]|uniref:Type IV secretion protein VblB7 n=1 Tax=Bartonella australis (strain Aust/NH1) TaxID=1094489 RepID=M1NZV1_BARAA|nr:hypothetical protein [Bartonella australis]AGF74932.1 type IV secretion protein VblB7 [Bartonella australis AUST/NH1]